MSESSAPNAGQVAYWNDVAGPKWVVLDALNHIKNEISSTFCYLMHFFNWITIS